MCSAQHDPHLRSGLARPARKSVLSALNKQITWPGLAWPQSQVRHSDLTERIVEQFSLVPPAGPERNIGLHQKRRWWKEIDCSWVYWYCDRGTNLEYSYLNFLVTTACRQPTAYIWIFKYCSTQSPVPVTIREAKIKISSELQLQADYYIIELTSPGAKTKQQTKLGQFGEKWNLTKFCYSNMASNLNLIRDRNGARDEF